MCEKRPLLQRQRGKTVGFTLSRCELTSLSVATINEHCSFHIMPAKDVAKGFLRVSQFEKDVWILINRSQAQEYMVQ